jgi:adenylosuccinate lyase
MMWWDTAQALLVRDASLLIEGALAKFSEVLARRAQEFRHTPQIGRTHGVHAEPITFGLKVANWYAENQRNIGRFADAAAQMRIGQDFRCGRECLTPGPRKSKSAFASGLVST